MEGPPASPQHARVSRSVLRVSSRPPPPALLEALPSPAPESGRRDSPAAGLLHRQTLGSSRELRQRRPVAHHGERAVRTLDSRAPERASLRSARYSGRFRIGAEARTMVPGARSRPPPADTPVEAARAPRSFRDDAGLSVPPCAGRVRRIVMHSGAPIPRQGMNTSTSSPSFSMVRRPSSAMMSLLFIMTAAADTRSPPLDHHVGRQLLAPNSARRAKRPSTVSRGRLRSISSCREGLDQRNTRTFTFISHPPWSSSTPPA